MLKAKVFQIQLLLASVFMLSWKINGESDCVKTFDSYSSYITTVRNIFKQSNISMGNVSVEYWILMCKTNK